MFKTKKSVYIKSFDGVGIKKQNRKIYFDVVFKFLLVAVVGMMVLLGQRVSVGIGLFDVAWRWVVAPRGLIVDRKGRLLVENRPFYFFKGNWLAYQDVVVALREEGINEAKIQKVIDDLPVRYVRYYPYDPDSAGVLGYVSLADKEELLRFGCDQWLKKESYCLTNNMYVGRAGIEASYEVMLQGNPGVVRAGKLIKPPRAGKNIQLFMDLDLQKEVMTVLSKLDKSTGMLVADVEGRVLAMGSMPSYEANVLSDGRLLTLEERKKLKAMYFSDQGRLTNKVYQGVYAPGSVFKMVVALAGLEEGVIDSKTLIEDTGFIRIGDYMYRNWYWTKYGKTDGKINVITALARSNDVFFYRLGEKLGADKIAYYAKKFGYGQKSSKDFVNEAIGQVPDPVWKQNVYGEKWFLGNTYHLAIGQGDLLVNVAQVARMTMILANGGRYVDLKLTGLVDDGKKEKLPFDQGNLKIVKEGMRRVCQPGGTAFVFFNFPIQVGCKTGTAENNKGDPHAWFTVFFPFDKPKYVVTVLVENGGEGSYVAAPLAKEVIEYMIETGWVK